MFGDIHFIWLGKEDTTFIEHIKKAAYANSDLRVNLWVDNQKAQDFYRPFLSNTSFMEKSIAVNVRTIDELKNSDCFSLVEYELSQQNYWAASDILRIILLYQLGGYYLDVNLDFSSDLKSFAHCSETGIKNSSCFHFVINKKIEYGIELCFLASQKKTRLFKMALYFLNELHQSFLNELHQSFEKLDLKHPDELSSAEKHVLAVWKTGNALNLAMQFLNRKGILDIKHEIKHLDFESLFSEFSQEKIAHSQEPDEVETEFLEAIVNTYNTSAQNLMRHLMSANPMSNNSYGFLTSEQPPEETDTPTQSTPNSPKK